MKVSTEIDNNFGYEKITQLVDNIPLRYFLIIRANGPTFWANERSNPERTNLIPVFSFPLPCETVSYPRITQWIYFTSARRQSSCRTCSYYMQVKTTFDMMRNGSSSYCQRYFFPYKNLLNGNRTFAMFCTILLIIFVRIWTTICRDQWEQQLKQVIEHWKSYIKGVYFSCKHNI